MDHSWIQFQNNLHNALEMIRVQQGHYRNAYLIFDIFSLYHL